MQSLTNQGVFLHLIRIGNENESPDRLIIPDGIDWEGLQSLAGDQGLLAVVLDGLDRLPLSAYNMPAKNKKQWIGEVLQGYEGRYALYRRAIGEMAAFYNGHGFKMMVLKGYACGLDWHKPNHRPSGDIDIWLFGKYKEADAALARERKVHIDRSHHHHTSFYWRDFLVENHYDFVNVHTRKSSKELDGIFKELGRDDSHSVEIGGERVHLPSPNLHALFLIRHLVSHFASSCITLRQVLDWAFFVQKHGQELDWNWLVGLLDTYHMRDFYNCINAICVKDLGFPAEIFHGVQFAPRLKERVLNDILAPAFTAEAPRELFSRLIYKYRRWQGNAWKQRLCYSESRWSTFWKGIWAKLLKPASI